MAHVRGSRATVDNVIGTDRKDVAGIMLSLADPMFRAPYVSVDERIERVDRIRAAIVNGYYRVRSADIAVKLVDSMREAAGLRFRKDAAGPTSGASASVSSTEETTDATFRPPAASESAEEVKHE
jgi:anti-sigma28 factor (negative regulator of flagellin synthesis)